MSVPTPDETILGLLAVRARHGYDLVESFQRADQLGRVWTLSTSQIYAVLKRLEREALISGHEVASPTAPTRTEYALTPGGEARLQTWLYRDPLSASVRRIRVEFLSRLFVARELGQPLDAILARQREVCEQARAERTAARLSAAPGVEAWSLDLQIAQMDAVLSWIRDLET